MLQLLDLGVDELQSGMGCGWEDVDLGRGMMEGYLLSVGLGSIIEALTLLFLCTSHILKNPQSIPTTGILPLYLIKTFP